MSSKKDLKKENEEETIDQFCDIFSKYVDKLMEKREIKKAITFKPIEGTIEDIEKGEVEFSDKKGILFISENGRKKDSFLVFPDSIGYAYFRDYVLDEYNLNEGDFKVDNDE